MTIRDIIDDRLAVIETYIRFMKKKIDLDEVEPWKYKAIVEGRKQTFESAYNQITTVNFDETSAAIGDVTIQKARFQRLIDSTTGFIKQIRKIAHTEIDVDESEDEKVKTIVQGKDLALELEQFVLNVNIEIKKKIDKAETKEVNSIRNFASERVKNV
jgi:hypothetical protein